MPGADTAARRYAQAAFEVASQSGRQQEWAAALNEAALLFGSPAGVNFLENAKMSEELKFAVIDQALPSALPEVRNLLKLLVSKGRGESFVRVRDVFQELWDQARGIAHAQVITAVPLSPEEEVAIAAQLSRTTGRQVDVQTHVDPSIIGGIVARIGDTLIDGSTRSRLEALKRRMEGVAP